MSENLGTYSFLPWVRMGLSNSILNADNDPSVKLRAVLPVDLTLSGHALAGGPPSQNVSRQVQIYGPGDVVGMSSKAVIRTEPRNYITNFEPNYLAFIEFYDEDFPWRYTPAAPDTAQDRLRPWMTLVILKEEEFTEGQNIKDKPLPYFELQDVTAANVFPDPSQLWAWAHVHVNKDLSGSGGSTDIPGVTTRLQSTLNSQPDQAYSRIVCPRRMEEKTSYHAFLIPTFETGRKAGLGEDIDPNTVATLSAWSSGQTVFPYYYRWYFKTGNEGDFEYLVNLLKPREADKRIGVRDMDLLHPGSDLPPIDLPAELGGILKLGGALRVPFATMLPADQAEVIKYDEWDEDPYPHFFQVALADRINLAEEYQRTGLSGIPGDDDPDPVVTMPLYARWHALTDRLLTDENGADQPNRRNWVHELNLDPRFRTPAGFGTGVVQKNQEEYMNSAWEQVGDVIAANNKLRLAQMAKEVFIRVHSRHLASQPEERRLLLTAPVQRRVLNEGLTVFHQVNESKVPRILFSPEFRKVTRPGSRLIQRLPFSPTVRPGNLLHRVNEGEVKPAPDKTRPTESLNVNEVADQLKPAGMPGFMASPLKKYGWIKWIPLLIVLLLIVIFLIFRPSGLVAGIMGGIALLMVYLYRLLNGWSRDVRAADSIREENQTPEAVDDYPKSTNFHLVTTAERPTFRLGIRDSEEAARFKLALKDAYTLYAFPLVEPVRPKLNLTALAGVMINSIDPRVTIPQRVWSHLTLPKWVLKLNLETFTPVMAYPEFDIPMYRPLKDISSELFLPNIHLIKQNSITLLESNQKFIESYMVGLNHEMARELLWREYPTDQRGSYFRQFWDVAGVYTELPPSEEEKEEFRDIPEIHLWSKSSNLGFHNNREDDGDASQLVLVIRGELLKKYPNAVIYAQKSEWVLDGANVNQDEDRTLVELSAAEAENPPESKIRMPLFEAKVDPDIYFFGFDLNPEEARGELGDQPTDDPGWYFVIKERPGEPRFGLDLQEGTSKPRLYNWNKLSWNHVETAEGHNISLNQTLPLNPDNSSIDPDTKANPEDLQAEWTPNTTSAELAYILYQVPVMVAVHASRMLPAPQN